MIQREQNMCLQAFGLVCSIIDSRQMGHEFLEGLHGTLSFREAPTCEEDEELLEVADEREDEDEGRQASWNDGEDDSK